jgi:hypothetical protein
MRIHDIRFEWKLADMWIGVFWKTTTIRDDDGEKPMWLDIWVCFLPCVPLHILIQHGTHIRLQ